LDIFYILAHRKPWVNDEDSISEKEILLCQKATENDEKFDLNWVISTNYGKSVGDMLTREKTEL